MFLVSAHDLHHLQDNIALELPAATATFKYTEDQQEARKRMTEPHLKALSPQQLEDMNNLKNQHTGAFWYAGHCPRGILLLEFAHTALDVDRVYVVRAHPCGIGPQIPAPKPGCVTRRENKWWWRCDRRLTKRKKEGKKKQKREGRGITNRNRNNNKKKKKRKTS